MRNEKLSLVLLALLTGLAFAIAPACSSGDDDDDTTTGGAPDAMTGNPDANTTPDAMEADYMGIGEACVSPDMPCSDPTATPQCLRGQGETVGFCSLECASQLEVTTDDMGQIPLSAIPEANHMTCADAFSGDGGIALCGVLTALDPMDPAPNSQATIDASCAVFCDTQSGGPMCPTGTTCQNGLCRE